MAKNTTGAAAVASAPAAATSPADMKAMASNDATPASNVREFVPPTTKRHVAQSTIQEDTGPDFFASILNNSGRGYSPSELKPRDAEGKFTSTKAEKEPEPSRKEEPAVAEKVEAAAEVAEPEVSGEDAAEDEIDMDVFNVLLDKKLSGEEEKVEEPKAKAGKKEAEADAETSKIAEATWAGVIGKMVPLGGTIGDLPQFSVSEDVADALISGDVAPLNKAINDHMANLSGWLLDNSYHANANRIHSAQAAAVAATNAFDDFFSKNPKYRGEDYQEAIGRCVQYITDRNPKISLRDALEKSKPLLEEATKNAGRINKSKAPAVVDQTGGNKGAGFKGGATRPKQPSVPTRQGAAPAAKQFNYVKDPFAFLMP